MTKTPFQIISLLFACLFPSLLTFLYFVILAEDAASIQKGVYAAGKILQFTFPLWFVSWILREKIWFPLKITREIGIGLFLGSGVGLVMVSLINSDLFSPETIETLRTAVQLKITGLGLMTASSYLILALFYALIHSFLEEYYWRWFVYGQMRTRLSPLWSNLLSSLGFMAHHIIVLAVFFGWTNPLSYLLALTVGLGGSFWAWHYERTQSLIGPWLSHMVVDATIFYVGYQLMEF